jgi:hypothetical protein
MSDARPPRPHVQRICPWRVDAYVTLLDRTGLPPLAPIPPAELPRRRLATCVIKQMEFGTSRAIELTVGMPWPNTSWPAQLAGCLIVAGGAGGAGCRLCRFTLM